MTRFQPISVTACVALTLTLATALVKGQEVKNEVFDELISIGIQIPNGPKVKLPAPLLKPGQPPRVDNDLLDKAADKVPVELFLKRSLNAPHFLKIDSIEKGDEQRCAQLINLRFVVYGKLAALVEGDVFKQLLGGKDKADKSTGAKGAVLSAADLTKRGIRLSAAPNLRETYGTMSMTLLDKVQVEGVTRNLRTTTPHAVLFGTKLDERFKDDKEYPNGWRLLMRDGDDESLGPPQPYSGLGGYALVTALPEPPEALLIELCFLLHEPPEWFGGRNLLRSKLPIPVQENVRSFRRKVQRD